MAGDRLERARVLGDQGAWRDARDLLVGLEPEQLGPRDHELLGVAAGLTGEDDVAQQAWERAHRGYLDANDVPRATRAAFWLGMMLISRGRMAPGMGWMSRAQRLLDDSGIECAETGRLLIPAALHSLSTDPATSLELFQEALRYATEYDDTEVAALARLGSGQAHVQLGNADEGVALFDEAMVAATAGDVSPVAVGIIYCAVILDCHRIFDLRRAREWTAELDRWTSRQQGLVPFRGQCLVHRSEMAQARGDWDDAVDEADAACAHLSDPAGDPVLGLALYQRAELHRLRGEYDDAEEAYTRAAELGRRDVPGRQLLLLARGDAEGAARSIRVAVDGAHGPVQRARVLAAHVEIMLATGDLDAARGAADDLAEVADEFDRPMLRGVAERCRALVALADGRPADALAAVQRAEAVWRDLGVPHEVARANVVAAQAYERLGDDSGAAVARRAARAVFEQLGARPDLDALDALGAPDTADGGGGEAPGGLSPRELEVIALVAQGMTNRQIAEELVISEKTVARHLSNIFTKLGVNTRTAASAWAWEHGVG